MVRFESAALNHIENAAWCARNNVSAMLKLENIVVYVATTDAAVHFDLHVVT